ENAALALQAYALLELPWQAERLAEALRRTRVTGRLDRRDLSWNGQPRQLLLDVGHNPQAAQYLAQRLPGQLEQRVGLQGQRGVFHGQPEQRQIVQRQRLAVRGQPAPVPAMIGERQVVVATAQVKRCP
ncbi:hypothetical protein ACV33Y_33195, partial [Pseudomonas aeruginosa]